LVSSFCCFNPLLKAHIIPITKCVAKNELFHLCAEIEVTGEDPPTLNDVVSMLFEDITSLSGSSSKDYLRDSTHRSLVVANIRPKYAYHRALRARHLHHNRFIRPRPLANQRRLDTSDANSDLTMDDISVTGGYNGAELFVKLQVDVSKVFADSIDELVRKPFDLLKNVDFMKNMFPSIGTNGSDPAIDSTVSFSAGAHASIRGKLFLILCRICSIFNFGSRSNLFQLT
jgi:hypothetical protein